MIDYYVLALLIILLLLSYGIVAIKLRCPKCNGFRLRTSLEILGQKFYVWTFWIPKKCSRCGYTLRKPRQK
jgi:hypothetical protein